MIHECPACRYPLSGTFPGRVVVEAWFKAKVVDCVARSHNEMDSVWRPRLKVTLHLAPEKTTEQPTLVPNRWTCYSIQHNYHVSLRQQNRHNITWEKSLGVQGYRGTRVLGSHLSSASVVKIAYWVTVLRESYQICESDQKVLNFIIIIISSSSSSSSSSSI
jgi:hypothetical protein